MFELNIILEGISSEERFLLSVILGEFLAVKVLKFIINLIKTH